MRLMDINRGIRLVRMLDFDPKARLGAIRYDVSVSSACNYHCVFCTAHSNLITNEVRSQIMSEETVKNVFIGLKKLKTEELLFAGYGEPLINPFLNYYIARYGQDFKIEVLTNGSLLGDMGKQTYLNLHQLTISLNTGDGSSHPLTHGYEGRNQFPNIVNQIERLFTYDGYNQKRICLNYVITSDNVYELNDFIQLAIDWNVSFRARPIIAFVPEMKVKQLTDKQLAWVGATTEAQLQRHATSRRIIESLNLLRAACVRSFDQLKNPNVLYPCFVPYVQSFITSEGELNLCCGGSSRSLGNINTDDLVTIWRNSKQLRYQATVMNQTGKPVIPDCVGCGNAQALLSGINTYARFYVRTHREIVK